jgi:hypothetical protein
MSLLERWSRTALSSRVLMRAALVWLAVALGSVPPAAYAEAPAPRQIDAGELMSILSNSVAEGRREAGEHLSRLGFAAEIDQIKRIDNTLLHSFSSRSMIEQLYRRAEVQAAGEGERFLAVLYNDAKGKSAALAADPVFEPLRKYSQQDLKKPFKFAPPASVGVDKARPQLSAVAEKAVVALSEIYSGRQLAHARGLMLRNFNIKGLDSKGIDSILSRAKSAREVISTMARMHSPPPQIEQVLRKVLQEATGGSAALQVDKRNLALMEELSRSLPPEYERYVAQEDNLQSRRLQMAEAGSVQQPGKQRPMDDKAVLSRLDDPSHSGVPGTGGASPGAPKSGPGPQTGGGAPHPSNPHAVPSGPAARYANSYSQYTSRTFAPPGSAAPAPSSSGLAPTPRRYATAIRSARAARGIAVGGTVKSEVREAPIRATWMANKADNRFGRLFIEFGGAAGSQPALAASRVMFADSFYAATSVLWGRHDAEATFRNGEILVLMSMDPSAGSAIRALEELAPKIKTQESRVEQSKIALGALRQRAEQSRDNRLIDEYNRSVGDHNRLLGELKGLYQQRANVPRGIVTHPGVVGRELAWSTARVDFWFNQVEQLSQEAAAINGGRQMPENMRRLPIASAQTWQFYELDSVIKTGASEGQARRLVVGSKGADGSVSERSHFAVSMFAIGERAPANSERVEENVYRLPALERELQAMLNWLATSHHDFMRLNDFSESFTLLRWLKSKDIQVSIVDVDGQGESIATPDRVIIGKGPAIGK